MSAILSSYEDMPIKTDYCFVGEVGLSGEIRAVNRVEQRIKEAEKLGFERIFISKYNKSAYLKSERIEIVQLGKVDELYNALF